MNQENQEISKYSQKFPRTKYASIKFQKFTKLSKALRYITPIQHQFRIHLPTSNKTMIFSLKKKKNKKIKIKKERMKNK